METLAKLPMVRLWDADREHKQTHRAHEGSLEGWLPGVHVQSG